MKSRAKRIFVGGGAAALFLGFVGLRGAGRVGYAAELPRRYPIARTDDEWKALLTSAQYATLRRGRTERAFTSPLDLEARTGTYCCAGCQAELFSSSAKFDSKTGWPSFWQSLPNGVLQVHSTAHRIFGTEVLCATCGGHLGHVFPDGPKPTLLRYCMNGVAMTFRPANV